MSKRPIGRPKTHWEDDVLDYLKSMNVHNWKKVVEQTRTLYRFIRRSKIFLIFHRISISPITQHD